MFTGYARVGMLDQNLELQRDALEEAGRERIRENRVCWPANADQLGVDLSRAAYGDPLQVLIEACGEIEHPLHGCNLAGARAACLRIKRWRTGPTRLRTCWGSGSGSALREVSCKNL